MFNKANNVTECIKEQQLYVIRLLWSEDLKATDIS